jgi:hypothetical protein
VEKIDSQMVSLSALRAGRAFLLRKITCIHFFKKLVNRKTTVWLEELDKLKKSSNLVGI